MPIQHTVRVGDTISGIAQKLGVPISAVSGFRSNDPNVIFPGEILTIQAPQETPQAPSAAPPAAPQAPEPQAPGGVAPHTPPLAAPAESPQAPVQPVQPPTQPPVTQPPTPQTFKRIFKTPSGVEVPMDLSPEADALLGGEATRTQPVTPPEIEKQTENFFSQFGVATDELKIGFKLNPSLTLSYLVKQVMEATGLPDVRTNITNISKEIESLANERDAEIAVIQENPWKSAGSKQQLIQKITDRYEKKIANRTDRLTLMQNAYQDARQQAQFAATTAINLYDKERTFQQKQLEDTLNRAEKAAEIERKQAGETRAAGFKERELKLKEGEIDYSIQDIGGRTIRFGFDATGKQVSKIDLGPAKAEGVPAKVGEVGVDIISEKGVKLEYGTPEYVVERLKTTSGSKTKPVASEREQLGKFANVVALTDNIMQSLDKTTNDPIIGYLKSLNPYSFDARAVNAQVTALVPSVARALYGEVGVLTDTDIERYLTTLPNIRSTTEQNKFIASMTLTNAKRAYEQTLLNLANSNINVAGFVDSYKNLTEKLDKIEKDLEVGKEIISDEEAYNEYLKVTGQTPAPAPTPAPKPEYKSLKDLEYQSPFTDFWKGVNSFWGK